MIGKKNSLPIGEKTSWDTVKLSDVTVENIVALINTLKQEICENFFIAFSSLEKVGKRAQKALKSEIKKLKKEDWRIKIFEYLINHPTIKDNPHHLISQLYSPDFIHRARAVMIATECSWGSEYFEYILPLLEDPDDSVRWAVLNYVSTNINKSEKTARRMLRKRCKIEKNNIIKKRMGELTKQYAR